jgi:hypothetical protein
MYAIWVPWLLKKNETWYWKGGDLIWDMSSMWYLAWIIKWYITFFVLWFHNEVDQLWLCHFIQKTVICSTIWNPVFFLSSSFIIFCMCVYDSDSHYTVEGWLKCLCFAFVWCLFVTVSPHVHLAFITNKRFSQPKVFDYNSFFGTELRNSCW